MVKKEKDVLELTNDGIRRWKCSQCGTIQDSIIAGCKKCGANETAFDEQRVVIPEAEREKVEVLENIIYGNKHVTKGTVISLSKADPILEDLKKRKLVKVV